MKIGMSQDWKELFRWDKKRFLEGLLLGEKIKFW